MKIRVFACLVALVVLTAQLCACERSAAGMQDGYYTAETAVFDENGWKEFLTIYVSDGKIVTAEYNARNASGFIKSWDMEYMRRMNLTDGTYPNEYTRTYMVALLNWQNPSEVDAITGATHSHKTFQRLAAAAIEKAKAGDKQVALIGLNEAEDERTEG